ncbi:MAG TPA: hypothetical protein VLL54_04090 [Pyrinomonadaceae bacterium]|nr:hypothetical protein [Pyrinomonadaceae bacterium]
MSEVVRLLWQDLPFATRDALSGKLVGLWGSDSDAAAFEACAIDKQQALLITAGRLQEKGLWQVVKRINNVYGVGGVGIAFCAWPFILSTLKARSDFTRVFANHSDTTGGFYERHRSAAVLHFLYVEGEPKKWYLHFDLYSPVHSPASALRHLRHEFLGKLTPDWKIIGKILRSESASYN